MNPMKRPVRSVLLITGAGLVLLGAVLLVLLWIEHKRDPEPWWRWILFASPGLAGVGIGAFSGKIAARLTRDFEE
jgi:hypothetical protein